jgi:hypothetical protein
MAILLEYVLLLAREYEEDRNPTGSSRVLLGEFRLAGIRAKLW